MSRLTALSGNLAALPVWARVLGGGAVAVACASEWWGDKAISISGATAISIRAFILAPEETTSIQGRMGLAEDTGETEK